MPNEFEIVKEVQLAATPEQVWETIATEAGLATWFQPSPVERASDMVIGWEPGRRLAIRTPQAEDGSMHAFEYRIEARGGASTVLRFVHSGFLGEDWSDEYPSMTSDGWDMYLYTLVQYHAHFAGRPAVYIQAEGPPSSSVPEAWATLVGALGPGRAIELEAPVTVQLPSTEPFTGVIDYATPNYIGLHTPDALIRFHGRASLGMIVAVSHHEYREVGAPHVQQAWESWLTGVFNSATM